MSRAPILNRGLMWGQLLTGLEIAKSQLELALQRCKDLLDQSEVDRMRQAVDSITGVEQRAWTAQTSDANGPSGTSRKRARQPGRRQRRT